MRQFIKRALGKLDKLSTEQFRDLLVSAAAEIDRLETVIDSLPRGILVCDTSHALILANKSARKFLSMVSFEPGKEFLWSLVPDEMIAEFLAHILVSADKAEEREFEVDFMGVQRLLSVSVMPLVENRRVTGSLILVDDITERKNREAKMRRAESLASLTTLAAGVAHEIKNPLGSISIHVQLAQKTMEGGRKLFPKKNTETEDFFSRLDKYLAVVSEEVERLNSIVVDFLFAVRPMNAKLRRGDLNALVTELSDFIAPELINTNITCVLRLSENLPPLEFDAVLMRQALLNLIKNAIGAMSGGGELTITTEQVGEEAWIAIADTGIGIPDENISKIFEPYFTTKETGTGLGLTLVFKIVKEHQGEINVMSREEKGSVFVITLPVPQVSRRLITYEESK